MHGAEAALGGGERGGTATIEHGARAENRVLGCFGEIWDLMLARQGMEAGRHQKLTMGDSRHDVLRT